MTPATLLSAALLGAAIHMNIPFQPVALDDAPGVDAVQLVGGDTARLLAASEGRLSSVGEARSASPGLTLDTGALPGASWDARRLPGGPLQAVFTAPGSGVSGVMSRRADGGDEIRLHAETFVVFVQPRFVKGPGSRVTAIELADDTSQVVLFASAEAAGQTPVALGRAAASITDARVLAQGDQRWLFTLVRASGDAAEAGPRTTPSGQRMPGLLYATRLDAQLQPVSAAVALLGQHAVYEFDVDAAPGNAVALFATTAAGAIYGRAPLGDTPWPASAWKETPFPRPLASPSLLVHQGQVLCAAISDLNTPQAQVLRCQAD